MMAKVRTLNKKVIEMEGLGCFRCNKIGYIKKNCFMKFRLSNVTKNEGGPMNED